LVLLTAPRLVACWMRQPEKGARAVKQPLRLFIAMNVICV
jgi:hypothetical protein